MTCVSSTALIGSAFIKKFSMDKCLESEYKTEDRNTENRGLESGSKKVQVASSSESSREGASVEASKEIWSAA